MQEQMPMENEQQEMVALLNSGDKRELRAFMQIYSKRIFERAHSVMHDKEKAMAVTRDVLKEVSGLAARGELKNNINAQLMALTDQACSRMIFSASGETTREAPAPIPPVPVPAEPIQAEPVVQAAPVQAEPVQPAAPAYEQPRTVAPVYEERSYAPAQSDGYARREPVPDLFAEDDEPKQETVPAKPAQEPARAEQKSARRASRKTDGGSLLLVIGIIITSILAVGLVWVLVVKLMVDGVLPNYDFGFARWFDANVFRLYY